MHMFCWHVWIWRKRCLPGKFLLRPKACLLCTCLRPKFFIRFLVVWDIVNNDIYITNFSINFESLLCIIVTAFCALNKKGQSAKSCNLSNFCFPPKSCMTDFSLKIMPKPKPKSVHPGPNPGPNLSDPFYLALDIIMNTLRVMVARSNLA